LVDLLPFQAFRELSNSLAVLGEWQSEALGQEV
jgi:hypothetical protein